MKLTFLLLSFLLSSALADDWPQWFGPEHDGVWRETGVIDKFPVGGPKVLWRTPVNRGYAGPIISKSGGQKKTKEKGGQFHESKKSLKLGQSIRQ